MEAKLESELNPFKEEINKEIDLNKYLRRQLGLILQNLEQGQDNEYNSFRPLNNGEEIIYRLPPSAKSIFDAFLQLKKETIKDIHQIITGLRQEINMPRKDKKTKIKGLVNLAQRIIAEPSQPLEYHWDECAKQHPALSESLFPLSFDMQASTKKFQKNFILKEKEPKNTKLIQAYLNLKLILLMPPTISESKKLANLLHTQLSNNNNVTGGLDLMSYLFQPRTISQSKPANLLHTQLSNSNQDSSCLSDPGAQRNTAVTTRHSTGNNTNAFFVPQRPSGLIIPVWENYNSPPDERPHQ
jgi:hypothetical protein